MFNEHTCEQRIQRVASNVLALNKDNALATAVNDKTLIREENSQNQNVRCTLWGEEKHLPLQELDRLHGESSTWRKSDKSLGPGQRPEPQPRHSANLQ